MIADMKIIFGQQVEMKQFESLYKALYRNGLGNLSVEPIWDNSKSSTFDKILKLCHHTKKSAPSFTVNISLLVSL